MAPPKPKAHKTATRAGGQPRIDPIVEERSSNDAALGGYDPDAYHGDGPIPVGNAPIHLTQPVTAGIEGGITVSAGIANPGDVRNMQSGMTSLDERETEREARMSHHPQMEECLKNCSECHAICTQTAQHCLQMGGKHAQADHIRLLLDCAQICQTSADFMLRESAQHPLTCGLCAVICTLCAESCEKMEGDAMMKQCADLCRQCAHSCHQMASVKMAA